MGLALARAGFRVFMHGRTPRPLPPELSASFGELPEWLPGIKIVLVAVPDAAIPPLATGLAQSGWIKSQHTVLHLSGVLDRTALAPLEPTGAALGSLHPLQTLADPLTAPQRLRGAGAVIEGDERATGVAADLARAVGMHPLAVPAEGKARYHAGAVFASNYLVAAAAVARRLVHQAGLSAEESWGALLPLMEGTLENLKRSGPEAALTGPIARGDLETIRRHVAALSPDDARLYRMLGREALRIATLDPERRAAVERALEDSTA